MHDTKDIKKIIIKLKKLKPKSIFVGHTKEFQCHEQRSSAGYDGKI
jgi:hypothetical protein